VKNDQFQIPKRFEMLSLQQHKSTTNFPQMPCLPDFICLLKLPNQSHGPFVFKLAGGKRFVCIGSVKTASASRANSSVIGMIPLIQPPSFQESITATKISPPTPFYLQLVPPPTKEQSMLLVRSREVAQGLDETFRDEFRSATRRK
jgi:hypothetical protein